MSMFGKYPAVVRSWDRDSRECRVEIPGVTDGGDVFPVAELAYPIGDKSEHTEIRMIVGDRVWVEFERGDPRFPIITAFRTKRVGNMAVRRQYHHENFQFDADEEVVINAGSKITLHVGGSTYVITSDGITTTTPQITDQAPQSLLTGTQTTQGGMSVSGDNGSGKSMEIAGNMDITGNVATTGTLKNNGKEVGSPHTHGGISRGSGNTDPVN